MKVLTVIPELGVGGAEFVATALATATAAAGDDACVASRGGFRVEHLRAAGVEHLPLPLAGRRPVGLLRSVRRLRATGTPDLVHAHNPKAAALSRLAFGSRVPVLVTLHGVADDDLDRAVRILRWAADHVVAVSPHLEEQLLARGFPASRLEVVVNGVAPAPPRPRDQARAELGIPASATVVLCPARMVDQKRHDLLVKAWARQDPAALLLLAGGGPNERSIRQLVARHHLEDRVRLLGERRDMSRLLAASDLVVLATDWEGLPIAALEAMAAGVPVVASDVPGVRDELGPAARLVEPGSVPALAAGIAELLTLPAQRDLLVARGTALVRGRFGLEPMVDRYRDIHLRLTGSPARVPTIQGAP